MAVILIVEDELFIRETAVMMVEDWGHDVLSASDVNEALQILRSPKHIDALFTDIYLKTAMHGGCDVARQAMMLRPDLRVLYTTGNTLTQSMRDMFGVGSHFLGKPYTQQQLQVSVEGMLAA